MPTPFFTGLISVWLIVASSAGAADFGVAHSPVKGSDERQAILEGVHVAYAQTDRTRTVKTVEFGVPYLKAHGDWAWIEIHPHSRDGKQQFEPQSGLFQHKGKKWLLVEWVPAEGDSDPKKFIADLPKRYPAFPRDILPK